MAKKEGKKGNPEVKVYTTPTCPYCKKTKAWLKEHKIKFKEINVLEDENTRKYIVNKTGEVGVPQIEIEGQKEVIIGFDVEALEEALL